MLKIEANTLEEAYEKASIELKCSITELDFEVIQHPRAGVFGFLKKNAIIIASCKTNYKNEKDESKKQNVQAESNTQSQSKPKPAPETKQENLEPKKAQSHQDIFNNFYLQSKEQEKSYKTIDKPIVNINNNIIEEVETKIKVMFKLTCYDIDTIQVSWYDENTLLIYFDGNDAALLIGKDGYRYKAISYLLFNWINPKYKLMIRLEISQFLKNQEEMIENYIDSIEHKIASSQKYQTKQLDGILLHIALTKLRERYPNKYIVVVNQGNNKYIAINELSSKK